MTGSDIGLVLLLFFSLIIGWLLGYREATRKRFTKTQHYLRHWFNSSQQDSIKSIERIQDVLDFDEDSFDTFIALSSMYRRKGEIERATNLHQSIIASPNLPIRQKQLTQIELGKDYLSAGIFDQAETTFAELVGSEISQVKKEALENLIQVYVLQREWPKAVILTQELIKLDDSRADLLAHLYAEQAQEALKNNHQDQFHAILNQAEEQLRGANKGGYRLMLLRLIARLQNSQNIRQLTTELLAGYPESIIELIRLGRGYQTQLLNEIEHYLAHSDSSVRRRLLLLIRQYQAKFFDKLSTKLQAEIINLVSEQVQAKYVCTECGFNGRVFTWQCPSCHEYERSKIKLSD